jgi:hypothetical protein
MKEKKGMSKKKLKLVEKIMEEWKPLLDYLEEEDRRRARKIGQKPESKSSSLSSLSI